MFVGVLSDSHGRHRAVRKAMEWFDSLGVEHVIHCGDVGGAEVFDEMLGRPLTFVWGNMDFPDDGVLAYLKTVGLTAPHEAPVRLELDGKTFAVFHGHEPGFASAVRELEVDYILHGHTHVPRDERFNGKRVINPGALFRARPKTVATLDTRSEEVTFKELAAM